MGTAAVTAHDLLDDAVNWLGERLVVGLDCTDGMCATHGWQQRSQMSAIRFVKVLAEHGVQRVIYTDTARDGMLGGPNLPGLADLAEVSPLEIILSGGIALLDDLRRLKKLHADNVVGVIVGRHSTGTSDKAKAPISRRRCPSPPDQHSHRTGSGLWPI